MNFFVNEPLLVHPFAEHEIEHCDIGINRNLFWILLESVVVPMKWPLVSLNSIS